jgi:soluble lytic murein transglycosylase
MALATLAMKANTSIRMPKLRFAFLACLALASSADAADQRMQRAEDFRTALEAAERGELAPAQAAPFAGHPLYPWLQVIALRQHLDSATPAQVEALLARFGTQPAGAWLRDAWLGELAKRRDWAAFRRAWTGSEDVELRCANLAARADAGAVDAAWIEEARATWLTATSLPDACDAPFTVLAERGRLDPDLRWQRIELAAAAGQSSLARFLARGLGDADAHLALNYADYLDNPIASVAHLPRTARTRIVATTALARLAKRDPARATQLLPGIAAALGLDEAQRGKVLYEAALWTVASYGPDSAARLAAVPESAYDDKLHEWRVREALARGDEPAALAAIAKLPEKMRADSRYQYLEARLLERAGKADAAKRLYASAAATPGFHGWLAADRLGQPYALCPLEASGDKALRARVGADPGLQRALEWIALDRPKYAVREWNAAIARLDDAARRVAVAIAQGRGWYDRAVFGMNASPDDTRYYTLRFPLHHDANLRRYSAAAGLDPAWVAAQTRAESAFMPRARSGADARGLMQLLPGTGAQTAAAIGVPWRGGESLYEPVTNLQLGTAYLRMMLDKFGGKPYLAIGAYNAGPAPVQRWIAQRGQLEPEFYIETIPYKETREYVARVLSFSVVYDWRLDGKAAPLTGRMLGRVVTDPRQRRPFACPVPAATPASAPAARK